MIFNKYIWLITRYLVLLLLSFNSLFLIYMLVTPITIYPVFTVLHYWYDDAQLLGTNTIFFKGYYAKIVAACVAGAAYYLLAILNLTTPMSVKTRIKSLIFLFFSLLSLNIIRILVFARLFEKGFNYFDITHAITWYAGSTVLVLIVWFANVFLFKIKEIPVYSDMKEILCAAKQK